MSDEGTKAAPFVHWLTVDRRIREAAKRPEKRAIGRRSKRKGKQGEKELAERLTELTGTEWIVRARDRDVEPRDPNCLWATIHVEAKRRKRLGLFDWARQSALDSAHHGKGTWVVICREDAPPGAKVPGWLVLLPIEDWVELQQREER